MFERIERGIALGVACWKVLLLDKEMLLFPVMSTLCLGLVIGSGGWVIYASPELQSFFQSILETEQPDQDPRFWLLMFAFLFLNYFIMIFFNAGLLTCALIRFAGGDPTVMDGLKSSVRKLPQILMWALITATVGWLLQMLESRLKGLARLFVNLLGAGWAVATYFVVPILVVDGVNPFTAISRSVQAVRKTWGEALVGHIGLGGLNFIIVVVTFPVLFMGAYTFKQNPEIGSALITFAVIGLLAGSLVVTTLSAILRAALYIYAIEGQMPVNFDSRLIREAFTQDKR
ncbi:hypothetical protein E1180_11315 [Roseibium denhamense]|uniref:DUF4013 domain-containing protein n=1 Tax=Roseibium denhamense TaxID=76305 RepID=A0ABY1N5Z0_9HYPH|nr:DUF6159 family protein [Roseibium denhamense]MTI06102.1 hypothetical protein [Roseibium denhamense]SMP01159.1 hypothetical protein SAMN06265374_0329 [Roseibium denhamense]